jgi:hypothetical protein
MVRANQTIVVEDVAIENKEAENLVVKLGNPYRLCQGGCQLTFEIVISRSHP